MVQPGLSYGQCLECQQRFHPYSPDYYPRRLDCGHNICTQCLTAILRDLSRLKVGDRSRPTTASHITCPSCKYQSRVMSEHLDRFPVDNDVIKYMGLQPGCSHRLRMEKICKICNLTFCNSCMAADNKYHEAENVGKALDTLYQRVTDDLSNLKFVTHHGSKELDQHYQNLQQSLNKQFYAISDPFQTKSTKMRNKFERQLQSIQSERERLNDRLRTRDTLHLSKSIHDSDCLIHQTYRQDNRNEIDKLNTEIEKFKTVSVIQRRPPLPPIPIESLPVPRQDSRDFYQPMVPIVPLQNAVSLLRLDSVERPVTPRSISTADRYNRNTPLPYLHTPQPPKLPPTFSGGRPRNSPSRAQISPLYRSVERSYY